MARSALIEAVGGSAPPAPDLEPHTWLREPGATFVTLYRAGALRGCVGTLEPHRPLIEDVRGNTRAAALADRRFEPVEAGELGEISLEVSVLSTPEELDFADEAELLTALHPQVDGVVLECDGRRGTFLPQVWRDLPEPSRFLEQLKVKAGLGRDFWSDGVRAWRYAVESFEE